MGEQHEIVGSNLAVKMVYLVAFDTTGSFQSLIAVK
jgi:hypothetical protein